MSLDGSKSQPPPEEKLLKLIRGKAPMPAPATEPVNDGLAPSRQAFRGRHDGDRSRSAEGRSPRPPLLVRLDLSSWWTRVMQAALGIIIAGELITLAVLLFRPAPMVSAIAAPVASPQAGVPSGEVLTAPVPSISAAASRPLFVTQGAPTPAGGTPRPGRGVPSEDAKSLAGRLSLIGIMGGSPAQAIIEDAQTKKTFFVTVGQSLIEGLVVSDVRENRVVLDLNGETIELSL